MTIDIVVNNYNYGPYVRDAVDSALAQDHPSVNVVVVDDGSTDASRERLESYGDEIDLVLKENGGQASAFNAGLRRCRGEAVIFLDADDMLATTAASRATAALATDPTATRVQFRMALIDADGRPLGATRPEANRPLPSGDLRRAELAFPFDVLWSPGGANAFRAEHLRRIMPIPERDYGRWGADYYLVHLTALLGPVLALDEVCASYRVHGHNAFEPSAPVLDLERIRREIRFQQSTLRALARLADELGLERPDPILSLSNIGLRIISRKLAPQLHPVENDRAAALLASAARAATRRYDTPVAKRMALVALFGAIVTSPPRLATRLAEMLMFPERRPRVEGFG
jgi:glycosyltransferase involved in cell wall biosynthesis